MLSIARLTGARVAYLERQELDEHSLRLPAPGEQLGLQLEAYLGQGSRVVGRWQGRGALALGLGEVVREGQVALLLEGVNPATGELLGRRVGRRERLVAVTDPASGERVLRRQVLDPVGGWDLVFAAPKSVSLAYALGSEEVRGEVAAAHEAAVSAALGMLERHAAYIRRGRNGVILEQAVGITAARFDHELARRVEHADGSITVDPHLHTHCALLGKALSGDGEWRALRHPLIIGEWQKPLGAVYRAQLRAGITSRLGWSWTALDTRGLSELAGWSARELSEMSQRRRQVEQHLADVWGTSEGLNGYQTRAAAVETRAAKSPADALEELQADWRARLSEHGLAQDTLTARLAPSARHEQSPTYTREQLEPAFSRLAGEHGLTARENTFSRADVAQGLAEQFTQGIPAETLEQLTDDFIHDQRVLALAPIGRHAGVERFTTRSLLAVEHAALASARVREGRVGVIPAYSLPRAAQTTGGRLSPEQRVALRQIAESGHRVDLLDAAAGTGKTTTLAVLADAYRREGYDVIGLAPSARAARELQHAGLEASTVDAHLLHLEPARSSPTEPAKRVVIVDEAGMIGTRNLARLLEQEGSRGSKVILAGDPAQLPSVAAGGVFRALCEQDSQRAQLREVQRQRDALEVAALAALRTASPSERDGAGVEAYLAHKARRGEITISERQADALTSARTWWAAQLDEGRAPRELAVIARTNQLRSALNQALREEAVKRGLLVGKEYRVPHERGQEELRLRQGERLVLRQNNRDPVLLNGMIGTVETISQRGNGVLLRLDDSATPIVVPTWYLQAGYAEHAYAITGHAAQGVTIEHALIIARAEDHSREWSYTASSRARGQTQHLIVNEQALREDPEHALDALPEAEPELDAMRRLEQALNRTDAERLAHQQGLGIEPESRHAHDSRLSEYPTLRLEHGLNPSRRDRGRSGPDIGR